MEKLKHYSRLVKFEHTIFALPFALGSVLILAKELPSLWKLIWIVVALVSARTVGMAFNRLIDEPYDRINPRTKSWPLPSGNLTRSEVKKLIVLSSALFLLSTLFINFLAFSLSPIVLFLLWLYPYSKRFTYFPHFVLGLVYLLIPVAVDVALNASVSPNALILGIAMASWVSGFDIIYALQDYEFDIKHGLKSIPVKFGIEGALRFSRVLHMLTFLSLLVLGFRVEKLGLIYFLGLILLTAFLIYEHGLIKPNDLSKVDKAFFTTNGYVSVVFFLTVLLDFIL